MSASDEERVLELRKLIPATGAGIYLDTAYRGPLPAETHAAMAEADEWELRVGRAAQGREEDYAQRVEEARAVVAALIGADPGEIALAATDPSWGSLIDPFTGQRLEWDHDNREFDATLAVGATPLNVKTLDVDSVYFRADRWLMGPEGVGIIWARHEPQYDHPFDDDPVGRSAVLGLARSIGWLEMYVGLDWVFERTSGLTSHLHEAVAAIKDVDVLTPRDTLSAIVTFRLPAWSSSEAAEELRRRVFAIIGVVENRLTEEEAIRASVAWFNTEEEIDRFAEAVAELARHTPETLPRKPTLVVH